MATYVMKCPECQYMTDGSNPIELGAPILFCLRCLEHGVSTVMRQVFTAAPVIFRGGGWASKS